MPRRSSGSQRRKTSKPSDPLAGVALTPELAKAIIARRAIMPREAVAAAASFLLSHARHDPFERMTLTPTQKAFYESRTRYRLISAANRGGKTAVCAAIIAACARRIHPVWSVPKEVNGLYCVFAPRRDQLVDPWFKKLCIASELKGGPWENEPLIPKHLVKAVHNTYGAGKPTPKVVELTTGHAIWFGVSGDTRAWEGLEGKGMVLGIAIDENAGTQQLLDECMARLLDAHSHPMVKLACGGGFLIWGATETKVNPAFSAFREKCRSDQFPDFEEFVIAPDENPAISIEERMRMRGAISDEMYLTRMMADGGAMESALVFPQFDPEVHCTSEPFEPSDGDCLYIGWDPGVNYSGHVYAAMRRDDPVIHVFAAKEVRRASIAAEAQLMASMVRGRRVEWVAYDQAARKIEKTSGRCAIWQLMAELRRCRLEVARGAFKGRSNYTDSVPVVRHWLSERRVLLHPGSEPLRAQFMSYRFTGRSQELKNDNIAKSDDHVIDAFRYLLTTGPSWRWHPPSPARQTPEARADDTRDEIGDDDGLISLRHQIELSARLVDEREDPWSAPLVFDAADA